MISWYVLGLILGILFLTEGKEMWEYNKKGMSIVFILVGLCMVARGAYRLSMMFV